MNFLNKIYWLFFIGLMLPFVGSAQRDLYNWQVSPYAGILTVNNDVKLPENANFFSYGLRLNRRVSDAFTIGLNFGYIHPNNNDRNDLSGGFLSVAYHWDNGYLLSRRSAVSIFHRLEAGYTDKTQRIENLDGTGGEMTFGFENGLTFRFGDRISADLAVEILGTKKSLSEGDIATNLRYNVWKVGLNYHFGSRKSKFVAPVFVPSNLAEQSPRMQKIDSKMADLWLLNDSVEEDPFRTEMRDTLLLDTTAVAQNSQSLTRADSLMIFMHFDSLYQRRVTDIDTTAIDTLAVSEAAIDSANAAVLAADTVHAPEATADSVYHSAVDSVATSEAMTDSVNSAPPTDSLKNAQAKSDTTRSLKQKSVRDSAIAQTDTLNTEQYIKQVRTETVITRVDTVYIERPDTSSQLRSTEMAQPSRVDTLYVVQEAKSAEPVEKQKEEKADKQEESESKSENNSDKSNEELQKSIDRQNKLIENQTDQIRENQKTMDRMARENKRNDKDLGKVLAAGAAGTAVGAIAAGGKKEEPDTVYVQSTAAKARADSLQREIDRLNGDTLTDSDYVGGPPIGHYFDGDTLTSDSLSAMNDSIPMVNDASSSKTDSIPEMKEGVPVAPANPGGKDTIPKSIPSGKVESTKPTDKSASDTKAMMASYPVVCNFALNSTSVESGNKPQLDKVITDLKNDPEKKLVLTGRTDKSGNADYNLALSKKRAQSVQKYLTTNGIDSSRISIESKGSADATQNYDQNARRVEVRLVE